MLDNAVRPYLSKIWPRRPYLSDDGDGVVAVVAATPVKLATRQVEVQ